MQQEEQKTSSSENAMGGGKSTAAAVGGPFGITETRLAEIDKWAKEFIYRDKSHINLPDTIAGILGNNDLNQNEKCYVHLMFGGILGSEMAHEHRMKKAITVIASIAKQRTAGSMEEAIATANSMMKGEA